MSLKSKILYFQIIFLVFIQTSFSWRRSNIFRAFSSITNITDFRSYFIKKTLLSSQQHLIIFGGFTLDQSFNTSSSDILINSQINTNNSYPNSTYNTNFSFLNFNSSNNKTKIVYNKLYKINLSNQQVTQLSYNKNLKPSPRYNSCGTIVRDRLFIYGGFSANDSLLNELWQYSFATDQWFSRGQSFYLQNCRFMITTNVYSNDTVTIIGLEQTNKTIKFVEYLIFNQTFVQNLTVNIYNSLTVSSNLWDQTSATSYLRIKQLTDIVNSNYSSYSQIQFPIKYFCTILLSTNFFNMFTNNGMYFITKIGNFYRVQYFFQRNSQQINQNIGCSSIGQWYFFIYSVNSDNNSKIHDIVIQYLHGPTLTSGIIHKSKSNLYVQWIPSLQFYSFFVFKTSIFIIDQSLNSFQLNQACDDFFLNSKANLLRCAFGMYSCIQGWIGLTCNISICKGSLVLLDLNNITQINTQCSGNGICTQNGCQCFENWTGQGCQIYEKKNCKGSLIQNFIESNCECNQLTTGGNECTVIFCYNDCSGHGDCQNNGQCLCNQGYKGPDCSILQINFKLI